MHNEKILSSLPLQVMLYFNEYFTVLWFVLNLIIFCWKSYKLYYTTHNLRWELTMVVLLPLMDVCRNRLATRGNKTEQFIPLAWSCGLAAPTVVGYVFFLELQTYVLHIDKYLNVTALTLISMEFALSLLAGRVFWNAYHV